MERAIHNFGTSLEEYVKTGNYDNASKLIENINTQLIDNIGTNTLNYMISNIFDESYSLLRFLTSVAASNRKEWKTALSEGLALLDNFLKNFLSTLKPYILEISRTCSNIVLSKASVYEKAKALQILCLILDNDSDIALDEVKDIYNKFYNFVRAKNTTSTVQKNVLILLGIILKKYPFLINNPEELIEIILRHLRSQSEMPEKKSDKNIVSGCIDSLSHILDTFPVDSDDIRIRIYSSVKKLLDTNTQTFELRDVLKFLSKHCSVLAEQMYNDSPEWWNDKLNDWTIKSGENRKAGYVALNAFYAELAFVLQKRTEEKDTRIFQYFYNYFLRTMKDNQAQILQVRLAICGFGKFAGPCKVHMSKQELSQMFIIIINRMEQDYFVKEEPSMEQLEYLPDYIQCFSTILHYIGEYTFDQIDALQQISVLMVKSFPRLSPIYYISVYDSMILTMCYLYQFSPTSLKSYLERVVYQSVLWTCSHRTTFDVDLDDEQGDFKKTFTYRNYLPLWKSLLSFTRDSNKNYNNIALDVQESVSRHLYNELIKTLLILINKLNLTTKSKYSDDEPVVDPQTAYQAEKIDDFVIFINVVDFYSHILPFAECKFFKRRIDMYNNQIMTKSVKYPLVSGFYKLLRISMELSEKLKFFDETQLEKEDRRESYAILCSFLENVLLKVQEFKDDLQVSCLQLLLAIPVSFVERLLPAMGPAFHMVFTIGRGYLKLAETAVDTLEKWYRFVPTEKLKPLFKEILPYLDPFLRTKGYTGDPDIKISLLQSRKTKQSKSKNRVYLESDGELSSLQHKILMFVGQLNSEICMYLVDTDVQVESVTWKKEPQLKFTVPYDSVKPNIYLDKIVPRIIELALSSGDQKTRITACELLHAIVIYMLGTSRTMPPLQSKMLSRLFEKLILPLIQLGCDSHDVIRQLFNPLIFQLVHWYSSPMQLMTSESVILVNTLMEGISHPTDTAVRDLSGKCIREFVIWTIKQNQQSNFEKYSINIKTILHKLCQYCSHPNAFKRLGAALAFNNLYTHLREERSLVDMYWIELLYWLLINMSLLDVSKRSKIQKNTQIEQSLNHIERVLRENSFIFKEDSKKRRIPTAIKGCLIEHAVFWILHQSASLNITYRRKCIKLFTSLAPYCNGSGTTKDFITKYVETSEHIWFLKLYENDGIDKMATLNDYVNCASIDVLMKWLQYFLRCLDAYKFLLDYNIIDNKKLITDSKIYVSLRHFIDFVSKRNLKESMKLFQNWDQNEVYMPEDIEDFYQMKRLVVIGILDFILSVIEKDTTCPEEFQTDCYNKFLCNCVFEPNALGFDTTAKENTEKLSVKVIEVLNKFYKKMPALLVDNLCTYFLKYFFGKYDENVQQNAINVPVLQRQLLKGFILLLKSDLREKMPKPTQYFKNTVKNISDNLVKESGGKKIGIDLQNTLQEYAELKLTLVFQITDQIAILCECLAKKEVIKIPETTSTVPVGEFFFNSFINVIMNYIAEHANEVVAKLCMRWQAFSDNSSLKIVMIILKYLSEDKQMRRKTCNCDLTDSIMSHCENVFNSSIHITLYERNFQIEFMTRVASIEDQRTYIIAERYPFFKTWFIRQLLYDPIDIAPRNMLHFKTNVLSFLHCVTGPDEDSNDALQSALSSFQSKLNSQPTDQIDNADRIVLFKRLLDYLIMSRSRIVLKCVADIFIGIKYDDKDINIDRALESYMESITPEQQYKSICVVYLLCRNDNYTAECKYKIGKKILMILFRVCKHEAFERFYVEYIKDILANLRLKVEVDCDTNMLINKSTNFMLIEALFSRIKVSGFADKSCRITQAAYDGNVSTGKELLTECIQIARLVRKEKLEFTDANLKELYRIYYCNAFNAIVSIISNSKKSPDDIKLYCYVFLENKDEFIWKKMIDCTSVISVPQDFDMLPIRRKVFVNIRNENVTKSSRRIRYIESQNLFNSTLSEDICKFDFTNTLIRKVEVSDSNVTASESLGNITIECVDMNNHECMATVCGLIRHLIDNGISPLPSNDDELSLPKWMEMIQKLMLDTSTLVNVKMFFARVIHNMKHIFKHYARYFFEPIAKFIVDKCAGNNINYLVADLVEMLVTWSQNITLEDIKEPASQLVQFLMENAHNDRHDMLKYNMEIMKTVVEAWKSVLVVPHDVLRARISTESTQQLAGINLISIMLANNLVPWTNDNLNSFMKDLVDIVQKKNEKVLYRPAAEVLGMCLQILSSNENYSKEFKELFESIETVLNPCTTDKLFHVMEQIQIHYPSIIDKHIQTIYFKMCNEKNLALKCICLRNILRRFEYIEFPLLTTKDYISFLKYDDHNLRLLTLQIVHKTIPIMSQPNTKLIVPAVCEHKLDSNGMIRCAVYDVLIAIYRKYIQEIDNESKELIGTCKSVLLAGLVDSDLELQEKMQKFWCHDSLKLPERFIKSLTDLYSPDTELFYLGCANFFLLEACKNTPEYDTLMFEHPLSDCKFDDIQMLINWRARYASMAPLFASTMDTQFGNEDNASREMIGVRASVSAKAFVPTVSALNVSSSLNPTSSFLFEATPAVGPSTVRNVENMKVLHEDSSYKQHSRRFLRDRSKIDLSFAKYEVDKKTKTTELRKERVQRKDANVVMYRKYRTGELPDVQIRYSAILQPLQMLARRDGVLARQLYVMLFDGLLHEMSDITEFINKFNQGIISVFNQTNMYVPNVIGTFLDIALENNKTRERPKIFIKPDVLSTVCRNSGLLPVGCLLLEDVISSSEVMPSSSKKGCANSDATVNQWVKLADMYKELNEWDAVIGIFSSKHMECSKTVLSAIHAEANGQWREALKYYQQMLDTDTNFNRKDFYYDSIFKSYANLSEWESISSYGDSFDEKTLWDGDWHQEKILPWYMTSQVCVALEGKNTATILDNLEKWMKSQDKSEYLKDKFSEELAMLALYKNDVNASRHYVQNSISKFLEDWSHLNPLFSKIRSSRLLNFQKIIDLNKYVSRTDNNFGGLLDYWQENSDFNCPSVHISEIRTLYRQQILTSYEQKITELNLDDVEEQKLLIKNSKLSNDINLISSSLERNNYFVARKYCKKYGSLMKLEDASVEGLKLSIAAGKIGTVVAEMCSGSDKVSRLIKSWKSLDSIFKRCTYPDLQIESAHQIFVITQNIFSVLKDNTDLIAKYQKDLVTLTGGDVTAAVDVQIYGTRKLGSTIELENEVGRYSNNAKVTNNIIKAYLSLIVFAQNHEHSRDYSADIAKYVLRGMKLGSKEARQLFPCLLQMPADEITERFKSDSSTVPTWMFVAWIPQILATLDTPIAHATADVVIRIATAYPQALVYAYRLSKEKYNLQDDSAFFKELINKLDGLLHNELLDKFINELSCVCIPQLYFNYHVDRIIQYTNNYKSVKEKITNFINDFNAKMESSKYFKTIKSSVQELGEIINRNSDWDEIKKCLITLRNTIANEGTKINIKQYTKLNDCSSWLANYQASGQNLELEIPGQFTGDRKPLLKYHAKISSFHSEITCIPSLRKPMKIVIFGNDSREYPFLLKFGEDLRQDQRIQQLLSLANNILHCDLQCHQRNLSVERFEVTPLTTSLGLIKWVDGTTSLATLIYETADDSNKIATIRTQYREWIERASKGACSPHVHFWNALNFYSPNETIKKFTSFVNEIPANVLSQAFWQISMDTESYTSLRHQFITSYASMSLVHWLFGIGDRNLGNCLILKNTGRAVGIDFGFTFGAGTQNLAIPELIPFRLTPHILYIMEPLRETGFIEHTMVHCLRALRKQKHIVASTMSVFINEPSVDWLEYARSQQDTDGQSSGNWYPKRKVSLARRKLDGANPAAITIEELKDGCVRDCKVLENYMKLVKGDDSNVRAQMTQDGLTEEEQVKCLLDQATDYNILGRMYHGLELWI